MLPYKVPQVLRHVVGAYLFLVLITTGPSHVSDQLTLGLFRGVDAAFTVISLGIVAVAVATGPHDWTKLTTYDYAAGAFTLSAVPWLLAQVTGI